MTSAPKPRPAPQDSLDRTIDSFWESVPPFWHAVRAHIRGQAVERHAISVEQFHILRHIHAGLGSVSELAEVKKLSRPAISQAVEALVRKGLVSRSPDPKDRRHVRLDLTAAGCSLLAAIFEETRAWMRRAFAALDEAQLETLQKGLELLRKAPAP